MNELGKYQIAKLVLDCLLTLYKQKRQERVKEYSRLIKGLKKFIIFEFMYINMNILKEE